MILSSIRSALEFHRSEPPRSVKKLVATVDDRTFVRYHCPMLSSNPADTLRTLLPDDVTVLDATRAGETLKTVKGCRGFLDAYEAKLTRHINRLHADGESAPAADLHTRDGGVSSKEAKQKERRAEALEQAPSLADKLETGDVTAAHADALADVTSRLDADTRAAFFGHEELLADDAARRTPEEFAKNCRDLIR